MRIPTRVRRAAGRAARRVAPDLALVGWPPERPWGPSRQHPRPRVGLVGFYGPGNYGDELFLDVFRRHLGDVADVEVIFESATKPYFERPVRDVVREYDTIVIGGGDLVIPWATSDRYWLTDYLRRPVHVMGVGVPTWRPARPAVVAALGDFLRHRNVRSITARDAESEAWIREHLRPRVEVASSADLVFAMPLPPVERSTDPPILGIVVRWREGGDDYTAVRALAARGTALGYRLRTIVLSTGDVRARDERALDEVGLHGAERISSDDLEVLTRAIGECTMLVSHKFHGTVVATSYGIPSVSMSTTDKNRNLLHRLNRPDLLCAFDDPSLPDRVTRPPASIDLAVRDEMAREATASLHLLRERIIAG